MRRILAALILAAALLAGAALVARAIAGLRPTAPSPTVVDGSRWNQPR